MSRPKNRNSLLAGGTLLGTAASAAKDHLRAMKYAMDRPKEPIYPLNDSLAEKRYPDYEPWSEKDLENAKLATTECLNNGYFEPPLVSNEYFSARNLIQETLLSSEPNGKLILHELSCNLTKGYRMRNDVINKITLASHSFKLPPRVTLIALKRDAWLHDLANPDIPLSSVALKIPHGMRNKVLIDHLCSLKVPILRALWFIKCVLCSEQLLLRKKFHLRQNHPVFLAPGAPSIVPTLDIIEARWLQEWTLHVADYVLKFAREMLLAASPEKKSAYQEKFSYLLRLVQTLYIELLLDRTYFLSCVIRGLRDELRFLPEALPDLLEVARADAEDESSVFLRMLEAHPFNYGQLLTCLTLVKMFWHEILAHDFLCKSLGELLLLNYFIVENVPTASTTSTEESVLACALPDHLKEGMLVLISSSVVSLFRHNSNAFIVPDFWLLTGGLLYRILSQSTIAGNSKYRKKFENTMRLINYRNESLMLNRRYTANHEAIHSASGSDSSKNSVSHQVAFNQRSRSIVSLSRSGGDILAFIEQLDAMKLKSTLAASLRPTPSTSEKDDKWRVHVRILTAWCTSAYRDMGPLSERILILCNFIKKEVLQPMTSRGSATLKAEFESEVLDSIFGLAHEPRQTLSMYNVYVLFNELYQLKVISISSYLRKIIAHGIFYISSLQSEMESETQNDPQISFHLLLLSNLPALNNKQHYQILSKWTLNGEKISSSFDRGMEISKLNILESLISDQFPSTYNDYLMEISLFTVGVKFLLVNWITTQIKNTIMQSPKLIHITPSTVARIYEFYVATDNLTLFFKVFVRFVLKNEDKVIIFYLDTLHYIGKLLQHHYLLVNFLSGGNLDKMSAAYELYNLIIYAYQDLTTRDPDLYDFKPLWQFMNLSVDKRVYEAASSPEKKVHDPDLEKYIFSKDTAESPLKVQVPTPRRNQVYSPERFVEHLNRLLSTKPAGASDDDIAEYFQDLGSINLDITPGSIKKDMDFVTSLKTLFGAWMESSPQLNEVQDSAFFKIFKVIVSLCEDKKDTFVRGTFLEALRGVTLDADQVFLFLVKMICLKIFLFVEMVSILKDLNDGSDSFKTRAIVARLIFTSWDSILQSSKSYVVMFSLLQSEYRSEYTEEVFYLALEQIKSIEEGQEHRLFEANNAVVVKLMKRVIVSHKPFAISVLSREVSPKVLMSLCCELLHVQNLQEALSWVNLAPLTNGFSLPMLQLLLRILASTERSIETGIGEKALNLLIECVCSIDSGNSYYGELFNYLEWEDKAKIFRFLETYFLTHKERYTVWQDEGFAQEGEEIYMFGKQNLQGTDTLPIFKDFFKKFSISGSLALEVQQFDQFSNFLLDLLPLVDSEIVAKHYSTQLHDVVSIFLRLLIIHSDSLAELISKHDATQFSFLKRMMSLLNSVYLASGQEKLKILLFDLLLQMKGSLTHALLVRPSEDLIATSPQAFGSASSEPSPMGNPGEAPAGGATAVAAMSSILSLSEPEQSDADFGEDDTSCLVTLDKEELYECSEVASANNSRLVLMLKEARSQAEHNPFNVAQSKMTRPFRIESVALIEDTSAGVNNGCISLSMFGAYTTKENPY